MLTDIRLQHFRSYKDESFELGPGVNIIVGPNASGKTNLLEAILVLAAGRSYRARDIDLVQEGQKWARLDAHTKAGSRVVKIENLNKSFIVNGKLAKRLTAKNSLGVVLFEPNHLRLLNGEPSLRREMLDNLLEQTTLGFSNQRSQYQRLLAQRNALLKKDNAAVAKQIFAWNLRLSELGGQVVAARLDQITKFNETISDVYSKLSATKTELEISYLTPFNTKNYASELLKKLESSTELDQARGFTAYGPHREDFDITINSTPMHKTASRGEIRTLLLALKLIELQLLEEVREQKPLLLLDDVFSELDGKRRRALTKALSGYQTFITTTDADVVVKNFTKHSSIIVLS